MVNKLKNRWTDEERRYLVSRHADGVALLAEALGRTEEDVLAQAAEIGMASIGQSPEELSICPRCGRYYLRPGTSAGRAGMCCVCWDTMKAVAMEERRAHLAARARYEAAKSGVQRARRAHG